MNRSLIAMTSITYAMKAKNLLNSRGMRCEIMRTPRSFSTGCGYSIRIWDDVSQVLGILEAAGIPYKDYTELKD